VVMSKNLVESRQAKKKKENIYIYICNTAKKRCNLHNGYLRQEYRKTLIISNLHNGYLRQEYRKTLIISNLYNGYLRQEYRKTLIISNTFYFSTVKTVKRMRLDIMLTVCCPSSTHVIIKAIVYASLRSDTEVLEQNVKKKIRYHCRFVYCYSVVTIYVFWSIIIKLLLITVQFIKQKSELPLNFHWMVH
jgi:hypothetical protein